MSINLFVLGSALILTRFVVEYVDNDIREMIPGDFSGDLNNFYS